MIWQVAPRKVNKSKFPWKNKGRLLPEASPDVRLQGPESSKSTCSSCLLHSKPRVRPEQKPLPGHHWPTPFGCFQGWEGWSRPSVWGRQCSESSLLSCSRLLGDKLSVKRLGSPPPGPFKWKGGFLSNVFFSMLGCFGRRGRWGKHIVCLPGAAKLVYSWDFQFPTKKHSDLGVFIPIPSAEF